MCDRAEETANASMSTTSAPPPREPGPKTKARADEARVRNEQRHARAQVAFKMTGDELTIGPAHDDLRVWKETVLDAFGTSSREFANREISRLLESLRATGQRHAPQDDVNAALAAVDGTRPENEMAAMLAGQMAVTHALAMDMLSRTKRAGFIDEMHALWRTRDQASANLHDADRSPRQAQAGRRTDGQGGACARLSRRAGNGRGDFNPTGGGRGRR